MHLTDTIPIIIPRPFVGTMTDRRMVRVDIGVIGALIGKEDRAVWGHTFFDDPPARCAIRMVFDPIAPLPARSADDSNNWGAVIRVGAPSAPFVRSTARWIIRMRMGRTFFPPRSGTVRQLQTESL